MQSVNEQPETLHIYVVREEAPKPQLVPIFLSVLALVILVALAALVPYQQPVTRLTIRVPAVLLQPKTFTTTIAIIPTGVKVYPAISAHGVLTITNGSVISQTIPQSFRLVNVITDASVFLPAGSANGYGYATVAAHSLIEGKAGNIPAYAINQVEGSSVYIRNLSAFHGGVDSHTVKYVTAQDVRRSQIAARTLLTASAFGLHYPCRETQAVRVNELIVTWRCQFVTYDLPTVYHVTTVSIDGKYLFVHAWFVARPIRYWVK
jgi:hypothetical protein